MKKWVKVGLILLGLALLSILALKLEPVSEALDGPDFCGMCHVMDEMVEGYLHSSHREVASCNDCHIPHDYVRGSFYKAYTGTRDIVEVLLGISPEVIRITAYGKKVVQENCLSCHGDLLRMVGNTQEGGAKYCMDCHRYTPHGR